MTYKVAAPATANVDAEIALPAVENTVYALKRIFWSYSGNLSMGEGNFKIVSGSTTILDMDLGASQGCITPGFTTGVNEAVTLTLNGVALLKGKVSLEYDTVILG